MEKIFLQLLELMIVIDFSQEKSIFISDLSGQYYFTFPDTCSKYTNKNLDTIIYLYSHGNERPQPKQCS